MGDPDLSPNGDSTFRDSRMPRVRAYAAVVCAPGLEDEAAAAAFVDLAARASGDAAGEHQLEQILLQATRSAAAGRFYVSVPIGHPELALTAECRAMPELLAAHANGERPGDEELIGAHLASCAVCAHTLDRMRRAEQAFARQSGELPALEIEQTTVDARKARSRAAASTRRPQPLSSSSLQGEANAQPASGAPAYRSPAAPRVTHRRRSGGLLGAIRRSGRPGRG